jgi:hypothetical protein
MKMLLALLVLLAQDADDPAFKRWSGSKVGSWVKFKRETVNAEGKVVLDLKQEITQTLVEADDKKVVVEMTLEGGAKAGKPRRDTYKAKTALPDKIDKEGDEEIEIAGKKLACHWIQGHHFITGMTLAKVYLHPDAPGGVVRIDLIALGEGKAHTRQVAVGWEKK